MDAKDFVSPVVDANTDRRIRIGIVGLGKMGHLHFKKWNCLPGVAVSAVVDSDPGMAKWAEAQQVPFFCTSAKLIGHIDAAIIATPVDQHVLCASPLLAAGIHCLIEKPIAPDFNQALEIVTLAMRHRALLAVGHSERFNPALKQVHTVMGLAPRTVEIFRMACASNRRDPDVDVVLDLMVHDLDWIFNFWGGHVSSVRVIDARWIQSTLAFVRCEIVFSDAMRVVLTSSYLNSHRRREVVICSAGGATRSINLEASENNCQEDPLTLQALAFIQAIRGNPSSIATGEDALTVMSMVDHIREESRKKYVYEL